MHENFLKFSDQLPKATVKELEGYQNHYDILKEWNEKINLVSRSSFEKVFQNHYVDSIYISSLAFTFTENLPVYDVGTGAGFPGIIFAIRYPQQKVVLVERSQKKQKYLIEAVSRLQLKNTKLELDLPQKPIRGFFFARAVYPPEELFRFFDVHTMARSRFVLNLGGDTKLNHTPAGFKKIFETKYTLPLDCGQRKLAIFERST